VRQFREDYAAWSYDKYSFSREGGAGATIGGQLRLLEIYAHVHSGDLSFNMTRSPPHWPARALTLGGTSRLLALIPHLELRRAQIPGDLVEREVPDACALASALGGCGGRVDLRG